MSFVVACGSCHAKMRVQDERKGTRFRCPKCQEIIDARSEPDGEYAVAEDRDDAERSAKGSPSGARSGKREREPSLQNEDEFSFDRLKLFIGHRMVVRSRGDRAVLHCNMSRNWLVGTMAVAVGCVAALIGYVLLGGFFRILLSQPKASPVGDQIAVLLAGLGFGLSVFALKPVKEPRFYWNRKYSKLAFRLSAGPRWNPFDVSYEVLDEKGESIGRLVYRSLESLMARTWTVLDTEENVVFVAVDDLPFNQAVKRTGLATDTRMKSYVLHPPDQPEKRIGRFRGSEGPTDHYELRLSESSRARIDRRLAIALCTAIAIRLEFGKQFAAQMKRTRVP